MIDDEIDVALVGQWLAGDLAAADALVGRHFDGLLAYAQRRKYGGLEPEEAVQNVFLKLIEKVHLWDPLEGTLRAWLVTIIENEFRSAFRSQKTRKRHIPFLANRLGDLSYSPEPSSLCEQHHTSWFNAEVLKSITQVLERLRPERAAFLLKPAKGFPCADRAALSRARRQIASSLGIGFHGPELTVQIARELMLVRECGKLPGEIFK